MNEELAGHVTLVQYRQIFDLKGIKVFTSQS